MISPALAQQILAAQALRKPFDDAMNAALNEQAKGHALGNLSRVSLATDEAIAALQDLLIELKAVQRGCDASLDKEMRKIARELSPSVRAVSHGRVATPTAPPASPQSSPYSQGADL